MEEDGEAEEEEVEGVTAAAEAECVREGTE